MVQRVGIIGITGYTGYELVRLVEAHPSLELSHGAAGASAGTRLVDSWPGLTDLTDLTVESVNVDRLAEQCDVVFLGLPHGHAATLAPQLIERGVRVVDLGADFRLKDASEYIHHYGFEHPNPQWLDRAVYGMPELDRSRLPGAQLIATPGCFVTAVTLAAQPLVAEELVGRPLIANCLSGVSGAGRKPGARNLFCEVGESARPYGLAGSHRHTPEIEQNLGTPVSFTPHLVPMSRGIIATVSAPAQEGLTSAELTNVFQRRYADAPLVVVREDAPSTADVRGSCRAHVAATLDERRGVVTVVCAIDNLLKGASGQAVQALNIALGLEETEGLPLLPVPI